MSAERVARGHYRSRSRLTAAISVLARRIWRLIDPGDLDASWARLGPHMVLGVTGAQLAAARLADDYADGQLAEQGVPASAGVRVNPSVLAGIASDGRPLESLLRNPIIVVKAAIATGARTGRAMAAGLANLDMIARTQVADAGRVADGVAIAARPQMTGYVRMLVGDSCSRCVVLAGQRYRWNAGFERHPACDCIHVPAAEAEAVDDIRIRPRAYFDSLTRAEQDEVFTQAGAQAIRDGADIGQVVNVRRSAAGLSPAGAHITAEEARTLRGGRDVGRLEARRVFGQDLFVSTEGTTTRGVAGVRLGAKVDGVKVGNGRYRSARAPRLMPESIYKIAGNDREQAIRLLRRFGYIT